MNTPERNTKISTARAEALQRVHRLADTHIKAFGADKDGLHALHDACFNIPHVTSIDISYYWGICLAQSEATI